MNNHIINIDEDKCIGCQLCIQDCPARNIELKSNRANVIDDKCIMCGHCLAICPKDAVSISDYDDSIISKKQDIRLDANDVLNVIRFRRTIRQFQDKDIKEDILDDILEAGRLSHTAKNSQDVSFIVLDQEKKRIEQMAVKLFQRLKPFTNLFSSMARRNEITDDFFFFNAPKVIIIASKEPINGALAAQNMEFVAEAYGLGVLYSGFFSMATNHSRKIKNAIGLPHGKKVITTLVMGYPKVKYQRSVARNRADIKHL